MSQLEPYGVAGERFSDMDDGGHTVNSLLMALLSFATVLCYLLGVYTLPSPHRAVP